jgi:predicted RNA binding protein YcfA (HicA-like mRNA interferase family)
MPSLPHLSGAEVVRVLERMGLVVARQRGSHIGLRRGAVGCVVPNRRKNMQPARDAASKRVRERRHPGGGEFHRMSEPTPGWRRARTPTIAASVNQGADRG